MYRTCQVISYSTLQGRVLGAVDGICSQCNKTHRGTRRGNSKIQQYSFGLLSLVFGSSFSYRQERSQRHSGAVHSQGTKELPEGQVMFSRS